MTDRDEARAEALDALHASLRDALDDRQPIPCRTPGRTALWTSEAHEDRAEAAEACAPCQILDPCRAAGAFEPFGTWGGIDKSPTKRKPNTDDRSTR